MCCENTVPNPISIQNGFKRCPQIPGSPPMCCDVNHFQVDVTHYIVLGGLHYGTQRRQRRAGPLTPSVLRTGLTWTPRSVIQPTVGFTCIANFPGDAVKHVIHRYTVYRALYHGMPILDKNRTPNVGCEKTQPRVVRNVSNTISRN